MKDLTTKEFFEAPSRVQYIYTMGMMKQPIGSSLYNEAIEEHPEYFPDVIEHRKKWAVIPQKTHDDYWEEYWALDKEIMKDVPDSKGIVYWASNPSDYVEWNKKYTKAKEQGKPLYQELHKKFYSKYGIEWNGW